MEKRCVITGLGLICAAGNDVDTCWQNICAGKTGIDEVKCVSTEGCVSHVGAEVHCEDLPAPEYDRSVRLCLHAAHEAVRDGRLTDSAVREAGVILGSCVGGAASIDHYYTGLLQGRTEEQDVLKMSASAIAANTAFALGANGETANIVNACAAGTMSVSYACDLIRLGRGEIFLAGGTDAFSSLAYAGFNALHALSAGPCSPLNHSNGISLGEGAGVLVVEEYEHAIRRGAKIYCEVAGWGVSSDAFHITAPQPQGEGQMAALHRAMVNAGTEAGDIGYINAHGTGTAKNDAAEFLSLHTLFEGAAPSVSSTKSMTGHCLGAAGAIEAVLSVKALTENTVLPTTGYAPEDLAPLAEKAGNLDCVVNVARERELENVMSNSFAFGGTNASIIFSKKPHPAEQTGKRRICVTGIGELLFGGGKGGIGRGGAGGKPQLALHQFQLHLSQSGFGLGDEFRIGKAGRGEEPLGIHLPLALVQLLLVAVELGVDAVVGGLCLGEGIPQLGVFFVGGFGLVERFLRVVERGFGIGQQRVGHLLQVDQKLDLLELIFKFQDLLFAVQHLVRTALHGVGQGGFLLGQLRLAGGVLRFALLQLRFGGGELGFGLVELLLGLCKLAFGLRFLLVVGLFGIGQFGSGVVDEGFPAGGALCAADGGQPVGDGVHGCLVFIGIIVILVGVFGLDITDGVIIGSQLTV